MHVKEGHEESDLSIRGIVVFAVCLALGIIVTFILAQGIVVGLEWWEKKNDAKLSPVEQKLQEQRGLTAEERKNLYPGQQEGEVKLSAEELERIQTERSLQKTFATPRLQYDDVAEMNSFRRAENQWLDNAGKSADGTIHIPISQAIDILTQRGLPAVNGKFSPDAPIAVPTGESRSSSHQEKTGRGLRGEVQH